MSADSENLEDPEKQSGPGSQNVEGEPDAIVNEIIKRLADLPEIDASNVVIHVNDDQVELQGSLPSQQRLRLMKIIQAVQGVEHVHWDVDLPHAKHTYGGAHGLDVGLYNYGGTHGPGEGPDDDTDSTHGEGEGPDDL